MKRVLIGCEESDEVRSRFERLGFDAWSCDLQPSRGKNPKHFQTDIFNVLSMGWDAFICFPPCTHLASSGAAWFEQKIKDGRQQSGIDFFMAMTTADIPHIAIENPVGVMSTKYRKPDQIIQPNYFGDPYSKTTCLWLKNLPKLYHNKEINLFDNKVTHVPLSDEWPEWTSKKTGKKKRQHKWYYETRKLNNKNGERSKVASKTFPGIADAMANQWGKFLNDL